MSLVLHKSLCDLEKAENRDSDSSAASKTGEQRGGDYFHRIQTGYSKTNKPEYRYFKTKDEWESYQGQQKPKKPAEKKTSHLKDKVTKEHEASTQKLRRDTGLFIKDKKSTVKKSLYIVLEDK